MILVGAGFSLAEVSEMTLDQINLYKVAIAKKDTRALVNTISSARIAVQDDTTYKKIIRDLEKDLNK